MHTWCEPASSLWSSQLPLRVKPVSAMSLEQHRWSSVPLTLSFAAVPVKRASARRSVMHTLVVVEACRGDPC